MKKIIATSYFSGLSGLQLNIPKYLYPKPYQKTSRLTYYASLFNSIEINSSFYKTPQPDTVSKWASEVDEDFRFTFKLWKEITHSKEFGFNLEYVNQVFKSINAVECKKGSLLIQFPPGVGKEYFTKLNNLLEYIKEINESDWKIALEFRNKSWYNEQTYELLNSYKSALVIHDIPTSPTPRINHESDFIYFRFHGPTGNYRGSYSEDFLMDYAEYVAEWIATGKTVFMYFNNTMGDALNNLKTINGFIYNKTVVI